MKLLLSLLVLGLSAAALFYLLQPASRAPRRAPRPSGAGPKLPTPSESPVKPKRLPTPADAPSEEEVRQAVQAFAGRFPRQTARVLRSWIQHRK